MMQTEKTNLNVAIVGGGILGVTLAYRLSQSGARVTLYERSDSLGGLASHIVYDNVHMDRFYHTILSSDMSMQALIQETGVGNLEHFTATKQGFYDDGKIYPFNSPKDFLLFPPLSLFGRFRLGLQVIYAQLDSDWRKMDTVPVDRWLLRISGRKVYEKVWKPLLHAKFDSEAVNVPATYIWSRLRRMMSTRKGVTSKELMCYLEGGYYTLIEAIAAKCEKLGVTFHLKTAIEEIVIQDGKATGVRTPDGVYPFDVVIGTVQSPLFEKFIPGAPQDYRASLAHQEYLGVLCPMLIVKKQLTPYYVLNITDETIPFTAVVETTNLIDPKHVGGHHIVYLPKYLAPGSEMMTWSDDQVLAMWRLHFKRMFPDFQDEWIETTIVQRARYVEPLRPLGTTNEIPSITTPVQGLFLANTVMVYPDLNNGESVTQLANRTAELVLKQAKTPGVPVTASVEVLRT